MIYLKKKKRKKPFRIWKCEDSEFRHRGFCTFSI